MSARSEAAEMADFTAAAQAPRAQAYLTVRRARGASTRRKISQIGGRSSGVMNNAGPEQALQS
jgi:hypothetical protein